MPNGTHASESSPYVELERGAWAALGRSFANEPPSSPLTAEEIDRVRGLGDELDLDEVQQVYLPLSRLLSLYVEAAGQLHRATEDFLHQSQPPRTPFVIGLAGSVAVGKSTTARVLQQMLAHWPEHPRVALVTTDGFLLPNAELAATRAAAPQGLPGVLRPQGAAEVRDRHQVRQGRGRGADVLPPRLRRRARREGRRRPAPTSSSSRGSTCSSRPASAQDGRIGLAVSDFFDFSVYVDAATSDIRRWYTDRFLRLRETAFRDPASYFARYASLSHDEAVAEANRIWDEINGPNLKQNVQPTRSRATLVLRKDHDHSVRWVRLRKL